MSVWVPAVGFPKVASSGLSAEYQEYLSADLTLRTARAIITAFTMTSLWLRILWSWSSGFKIILHKEICLCLNVILLWMGAQSISIYLRCMKWLNAGKIAFQPKNYDGSQILSTSCCIVYSARAGDASDETASLGTTLPVSRLIFAPSVRYMAGGSMQGMQGPTLTKLSPPSRNI